MKIVEGLGDKSGVANALAQIGAVYKSMGNNEKAMEYNKRGLEIAREEGDNVIIARVLNNIGVIYANQGDSASLDGGTAFSTNMYSKAISYYKQSLEIEEAQGNIRGIAVLLHNIGNTHNGLGNNKKAITYLTRSLKIGKEIEHRQLIANSLHNIGNIYFEQGSYSKAMKYGLKSLNVAQEVGLVEETMNFAEFLCALNKKLGNYKDALKMYELYISTRDSLDSEENQKAVIRQEYKYQYEKQAAADSIKATEASKVKDAQIARQDAFAEKQEAEIAQKKTQQYALFGGLALLIGFGAFIFNRLRIARKQNRIIQEQKEEVDQQREIAEAAQHLAEEKNKEITDSINYARRLQEAILPPVKLVKEYLQNSFILFKPKDVVSGDFYWMETLKDTVYFAAADCTGHGVPGAMVSVVCSNALSKSLIEEGNHETGKLLDRTRELVIERFGRSEEEIKDGMDISLCALNTKTNNLMWSGANNPLWIIRNGESEIEEVKADKQPIGKYAKENPFTTHQIQLNEGDSAYIFSDGYPDQFGGEKGKKYKSGKMKRFLLSIVEKDAEQQRKMMLNEFESWRGDIEQIDDVCVIGFKI